MSPGMYCLIRRHFQLRSSSFIGSITMARLLFAILLITLLIQPAKADPIPKGGVKFTGILVLDDCDPIFRDKDKYEDNVIAIYSAGKIRFRISGFNTSQTIGGMRKIAVDSTRDTFWVYEDASHRIRGFDFSGKETRLIKDVNCSAIAIDPKTGHLWVVTTPQGFGTGPTVVYDRGGRLIATYDIKGTDIVYDRKYSAFWIAGKELARVSVSAKEGDVIPSIAITKWTASTLDVDPKSGSVWVGVRKHPDVAGSEDRLLKYDRNGNAAPEASIDLGDNSPSQVSVSPVDGCVWIAAGKVVRRYSSKGKLEFEKEAQSSGIQIDTNGRDVWLVTANEIQKMSADGKITVRVPHVSKSSQAWITLVE